MEYSAGLLLFPMAALHPAWILGVTVPMALAFGLVGVLIAAPLAGIIKAHFEEFDLVGHENKRTKLPADSMIAEGSG